MVPILSFVLLLFVRSSGFVGRHVPRYFAARGRLLLREKESTRGLSFSVQENKTRTCFPDHLIKSLDLLPLMRRVAAHAATRRGKDSLLALVGGEQQSIDDPWATLRRRQGNVPSSSSSSRWPSRFRDSTMSLSAAPRMSCYQTNLAASMAQVTQQYERVKQATLVLQGFQNETLSLPPLYGTDNSINPWSVDFVAESDDDHWLHHSNANNANENMEEILSLQDVLQAEQVTKMILAVFDWASQEQVLQWTPLLADIIIGSSRIANDALSRTLQAIQSAVEIVRVQTVVDPSARSTYHFQLNGTTFRVLGVLRDTAREIQEGRPKMMDSSKKVNRRLSDMQQEIRLKEREIHRGLALAILQSRQEINNGLNAVAELDVVFTKASFGLEMNGRFPCVLREGRIDVDQFVHPLLLANNVHAASTKAVPIDLRMSGGKRRALTISGMNGGGKSVALKSFGVAACLVHLGIAIPSRKEGSVPRVDFFDEILTSVGDGQDVSRGESTFTAQLNTYSTIIDVVSRDPDQTYLILLDELGAGTEASSGAAIGQAILERLLQTETCRIVVTTHSPRLKSLSFESNVFDCASVLLSYQQERGGYRHSCHPTFQLQYGVIGESYAIEAANRCSPALPPDVLERATNLVLESKRSNVDDDDRGESADYIRVLSRSLETQVQLAEQSSKDAQDAAENAAKCRWAMFSLANAYDRHLSLLQNRAEECYQLLQNSLDDSLKIVGETLSELRVVREQVKSEAELLRDQGLKIVPDSYMLSDGESVVVVSDVGEWNGFTGRVTLAPSSNPYLMAKDEVLVVLSSSDPMDNNWMLGAVGGGELGAKKDQPIAFKRYQLAIWDYDCVWKGDDDEGQSSLRMTTSMKESKRRLTEVLASIKSPAPKVTSSSTTATSTPASSNTDDSIFKSSRERKAAKANKEKRKKRK